VADRRRTEADRWGIEPIPPSITAGHIFLAC